MAGTNTDQLGQRVLAALRSASPTSSHASWIGSSPSSDLVFVVRASSVPGSHLSRMVSSCAAVPGVGAVRYEIDCGDRAVRVMVAPSRARNGAPAWLALEAALLAWAAARLLSLV